MDPLFPPPPFSFLPPGAGAPEATDPAPPQNHAAAIPQPPYADMIYGAITALKERDGSSKQAITKYIEKEYTGMLPDGYAEMLTQHLKRLKNSGLLVLNKKSYMLPSTRSEPVAAPNPPPAGPAAVNGSYSVTSPAEFGFFQVLQQQQQTELMFPPGIPPNLFMNPFQQQFAAPAPAPAPFAVAEGSDVVKRGRGRPRKAKNDVRFSGNVQEGDGAGGKVNDAAQPVFVALGLADDPTKVAKRRPGRPKKFVVAGEDSGAGAPGTEGMPQQQVMKRGRGRPPGIGARKMGGPGKPELNNDGDTALLNNVRPKPRGRPRKGVVVPGVGGIMAMKRMGRPAKAIAGLKYRPRTSSGRPVGRPRKYQLLANEAHLSGPQSEGYEDMRKKLEFFQSRIMHAVHVLKPEFRNESSHDAIKAIQELEGLASVDITTPFIEDPQPAAAAAPQQI